MADVGKVKNQILCGDSKAPCENCWQKNTCPYLAASNLIESQQEEIELFQPRWIPIEDAEKPKTLQMVWVAYRMHDGKICTRLAKYRDYGKTHWLYPWDGVLWEDVIAWMPLKEPEPPREG